MDISNVLKKRPGPYLELDTGRADWYYLLNTFTVRPVDGRE